MKSELSMLIHEANTASLNIATQLRAMLGTDDRLKARRHGRRICDSEMIVMARTLAAKQLETAIEAKQKKQGRLRMVSRDNEA
jgi:hypothetical protein